MVNDSSNLSPESPSDAPPVSSREQAASPTPFKPYPFTNDEIEATAQRLWQQRGWDSDPERNWQDAIALLTREYRIKLKEQELQQKRGQESDANQNRKDAERIIRRQYLIRRIASRPGAFWKWTGIPDKKGWDLLTSISLPLIIFLGGTLFTYWNNQQQQRIAEDNRKQDIQLADDKAKQDTLVKYLDDMSKSIESGLLQANPGDDKFIVARSRTVLALQSLDKHRQHLVIQFLQASRLNQLGDDDESTQKFLKALTQYPNDLKILRGNPPNPSSKVRLGLLYGAQMVKANFSNSDLSGATLIGVNLQEANLGCNPPDSKEPDQCSNLINVILNDANLNGTNFDGANLRVAFFQHAFLSEAHFNGANLRDADFERAILNSTNFNGANLSNANLSDTYLINVDFSNATLKNINLSGAILLRAYLANTEGLTSKQLEGKNAPLLCNVVLPESIAIDKNRDCGRLPEVFIKRLPQEFPNLQEAEKYVNRMQQQKFGQSQ